MSARKRPLSELSQAQTNITPGRYAPSTPHAIRALQQRSSAKRSARSARSVNKTAKSGKTTTADIIRPDGSARNILKQFARITAPLTKKRISTPIAASRTDQNKENTHPADGEDDNSIILKQPKLTFNIEESIEEEESELLVAPTPSALLEDTDDDIDDDDEQPTVTFQNVAFDREGRAMSEKIDRRRSRASMLGRDDDDEDENEQEVDATILTERGRRALSEEATGRLSRYSFGSFRMSEFGSELEIRRDSDRQQKLAQLENEDDYVPNGNDDITLEFGGDAETPRTMIRSPTEVFNDESLQLPGLGDDTFNLQMPEEYEEEMTAQANQHNTEHYQQAVTLSPSRAQSVDKTPQDNKARRQTLLETATTKVETTRRKRVKLTRHGTTVPALPSSLVKRVAVETQTSQGRRKPKFGRDHVKALEQATEWFFEQIGEDLAAYSSHGKRKRRVDVNDALLLMRRQKVLQSKGDIADLAKVWLPKDVLEQLELPEKP